jgi:hypothetical protein
MNKPMILESMFKGIRIVNPTGQGVRNDPDGDGHHKAKRGMRLHDGIDFVCDPGQSILMPIDGVVDSISYPYADKTYKGVLITSDRMDIKMWYFDPYGGSLGEFVEAGRIIGRAQDISEKHHGMTPHIHLRIDKFNPALVFNAPEYVEEVVQ